MNKRAITILIAISITGFAALTCLSQDASTAAEAAGELKIEKKRTLLDTIKTGGWAMWPLGACSFAVVALSVLNFQKVSRKRMIPAVAVAQIKSAAQSGNYQQMLDISASTDSFFTHVFASGISKLNPADVSGSMPRVEAAMAEAASREESKYSLWINFLSLLTGMSPMWGLLGTISGMIGAFDKIGAGGMGKPELLASNIGEALITTATGLLVAIPAMGAYFIFRNILTAIIKDAEYHFSDILETAASSAHASPS